MVKKTCLCCLKDFASITRCFVNNRCTWKSCPSCINKQIKLDNQLMDVVYDCPQCRKQSVFKQHTRFTRYIKGNRGSLLYIYKLQHKLLDEMSKSLATINQSSLIWQSGGVYVDLFEPVVDIAGNEIETIPLVPPSP